MNLKRYVLRDTEVKRHCIEFLCDVPLSDPPMQVTFAEYRADKSGEQRSWFHMLCRRLASETGYTEGEIKEYVKRELWGTLDVVINGRLHAIVRSSESANRQEYSELIEAAYRIGAEAGIVLPPPMREEA